MSLENSPNRKLRRKKSVLSVEALIKGILEGDKLILSQAITLVESTRKEHRVKAQKVIEACLPHRKKSIRIGITGVPGVGKSTFIEALGTYVDKQNHKLAVLAIDPSSGLSKGSILGDKTRMQHLTANEKVFIRPSPTGSSLGGVARKTRETIMLCEAAGFDTIFVETVGVGQSEITVHSMVDFFLLLLLPGAGDELQGIKRGIVEMADMIVVNKADGDHLKLAKRARQDYWNAIHLFPPKSSGRVVPVLNVSALEHRGMDKVWEEVMTYQSATQADFYFQNKRSEQLAYWLEESIRAGLQDAFYAKAGLKNLEADLKKKVVKGSKSPFQAAEELLDFFTKVKED